MDHFTLVDGCGYLGMIIIGYHIHQTTVYSSKVAHELWIHNDIWYMGLSETREPQEIRWSIIIMPITVNWSFRGITNVQTNSYKPIIIHNLNNIYIYNIIYIHIVIYIYIILHNYTLILIINSNTHIIFRYLDHTSTWSPALPGRHRPVALHL